MSNIDQEAEKRQWEELAAASGVHLGSVDLQDGENMKELYDLLRVHGVGPTSRLRTYIKSLQSVPQQQQKIPAETLAGLSAMAKDYLAKKKTIVLSEATGSAKNEVLDMLELTEAGASWPNKPAIIPEFPSFQWLPSKEDSPENRAAYMAHLVSNVRLPAHISMADVQPDRTSLSVEILGMEKSRKFSGTTDIVISEVTHIQNDALRNTVEALLELKKPNNMKCKDHNPQAICAHVAASYLNRGHAVVSVLTDLNSSWTFYWFANTESRGVALYKLKLSGKERGAGLAKYILESIFDDNSHRETLPTTFVDRLPFEAVISAMVGRHNRKRAHEHSGGQGHGEGGSGSQDQSGRHGSLGYPPSPFGPGNNSTGGQESQDENGTGQGSAAMDAAKFLSLFAPPSSRDVANELELLDMVDEADQYEIVRSFAAKHIVPFMAGQNQ